MLVSIMNCDAYGDEHVIMKPNVWLNQDNEYNMKSNAEVCGADPIPKRYLVIVWLYTN